MTKGTTSMGKFTRKKTHIRCRRCGHNSYHKRGKRCASAATPTQEFANTNGLSDRSSDTTQSFSSSEPWQTHIMSTEIALIAGSSIAGVISAVFLDKLFRFRSNNKKPARPSSSSASIRAELLSLLFEKNLTS